MKLHVVDGTWELFRAHFSKRPRAEVDGRDVKATLGVLDSLLALIQDPAEHVTHIAVAFDNPIRSFRNDLFPGYKTDEGVPPELLGQFDLVEEATAALGVVVWRMGPYECDDALATAAVRYASEVEEVRICTPDKDLGQAVGDAGPGARVVQVDRLNGRVLDVEGVRQRLGVSPASVPDYFALVGDDADGIPGLPGFGARSAAALLNRWGHLEQIPRERPELWELRGAGRLAAVLRERWSDALLYRTLATLVTDVPLAESLDDLRWRGPTPALTPLLIGLRAQRLLQRALAAPVQAGA